jgi:hypothetical protein
MLKCFPLKPSAKSSRTLANMCDHSAFALFCGKKEVTPVFKQIVEECMEPKILRLCPFMATKGNAGPSSQSPKPFLKILAYPRADVPNAVFRYLD